MDSRLIHKTSEKLKFYIDWIKPGETEWIYCGVKGEIKIDLVRKELEDFFKNAENFNIAVMRKNSYTIEKTKLLTSIIESIGISNFFIWTEDFQEVMEFSKIGVFRKGRLKGERLSNYPVIPKNKIKPTTPDKIYGKLVKYRKGDCLSINFGEAGFLAVFISEKFNKYYDLTLIEFLDNRKPMVEDFTEGLFFGRYIETSNGDIPSVEKHMMLCLDTDENSNIEKVGSIELIDSLNLASYGYPQNFEEILKHYKQELPLRLNRNIKLEKNTETLFNSNRLIKMSEILKDKKTETNNN
jgi:hypothetical protein